MTDKNFRLVDQSHTVHIIQYMNVSEYPNKTTLNLQLHNQLQTFTICLISCESSHTLTIISSSLVCAGGIHMTETTNAAFIHILKIKIKVNMNKVYFRRVIDKFLYLPFL